MGMNKELSIGFIGAGRLAGVLAPVLFKSGYGVSSIASRSRDSASVLSKKIPGSHVSAVEDTCADLIFITTTDSAITDAALNVHSDNAKYVVHCSGASSLEKLAIVKEKGLMVGSWHPYQTFNKSTALEGVTFGIEAESPLKEILYEMTLRVNGIPLEIPSEMRALYHASSVMSCGYLATLFHSAWQTWISAGLSKERGLDAVLKIMRSTLDAIEEHGFPDAVTGPIVRGDKETVNAQLGSIRKYQPSLVGFYEQISLLSIKMAQDYGIAGVEQDWADVFATNLRIEKCD
ncbi:MAG: DUF2520 domain-containing protein [SAR202 cluster bacterium]|nr:DUF2520 domain-containing protein [SAR202 cluster bacterium]|tara:strand:- start:764 stop:1633 length:870 start_codon:yes stop_codon:yes gene_type:complete